MRPTHAFATHSPRKACERTCLEVRIACKTLRDEYRRIHAAEPEQIVHRSPSRVFVREFTLCGAASLKEPRRSLRRPSHDQSRRQTRLNG